jgi:arginase
MLHSIGREIVGTTTIPCPKESRVASAGRMKHAQAVATVGKRTASAVEAAVRRGETVVALGGDHSTALGSIAGAAAALPKLGVIYIDAHPDCNTDETTITGNVHGMVTAALQGFGHAVLTEIPKRTIPSEHFLYIGLKDLDAAEIEFLRSNRLTCFTMLDIATRGLHPIVSAIGELSQRVDHVWISMDMDSIDAEYAPGVGLSGSGGLTRREVLALAHRIGKTCRVAGFDLVEMLPAKDAEAKTARLALEIAARFLGGEYTWYQQQYIDTYRETNVTGEPETVTIKPAQEQGA